MGGGTSRGPKEVRSLGALPWVNTALNPVHWYSSHFYSTTGPSGSVVSALASQAKVVDQPKSFFSPQAFFYLTFPTSYIHKSGFCKNGQSIN